MLPLYTRDDAESAWSEAIYTLRARILGEAREGRAQALLTSFWPGEGKSLVALNLAYTLAQLGRKTLLLDGNPLRPTLSAMLQPEPRAGLVQLAEHLPEPQPVLESNYLRFVGVGPEVLSTRGVAVHPSDVLSLSGVTERLRQLYQDFECVVVDGVSLSEGVLALRMGQSCSSTFIVSDPARFQGIPEGHLCEDAREAGLHLCGIVGNNRR